METELICTGTRIMEVLRKSTEESPFHEKSVNVLKKIQNFDGSKALHLWLYEVNVNVF